MQHLENDMDDLFKRAAENYPLRQGDGDWESIAKRISDKSDGYIVLSEKNNTNKKIIALCLLLLMLTISWFIIRHHYSTISSLSNSEIKTGKDKRFLKPVIKNNDQRVATKEDINSDVALDDGQAGYYNKRLISTSSNISVKLTPANSSDSFYTGNAPAISHEKRKQDSPVTENAENKPPTWEKVKGDGGKMKIEDLPSNKLMSENEQNAKEEINPLKKTDSLVIAQNNKKQKNTGLPMKKGFYFGIAAGADLSKVQSMAFSNAGIAGGLIAGLTIGKRLSLESGITWNKKHYDSRGSDFNMDKVGASMATGMVINNLASSSSLIEIPIKVKYDFVSKKRSAFFVAGGVSAYIMTKEKNNYNVTMNGNQKKMTGTYNKINYGLPAVANFSAGYQHTINARLQIRIEPFLKIPLKGMGVGSLPITSAGLQFGIISRLK